MDEQNLEGFERRDTLKIPAVGHEFHIPSQSPNHNAETEHEVPIVNKVSYDTCARLNAFINYARVDVFIYMGNDMVRLISIKPAGDDYVECVVNHKGDVMQIVAGAWIPFMMYFRRVK